MARWRALLDDADLPRRVLGDRAALARSADLDTGSQRGRRLHPDRNPDGDRLGDLRPALPARPDVADPGADRDRHPALAAAADRRADDHQLRDVHHRFAPLAVNVLAICYTMRLEQADPAALGGL